MRHNLLRLRRRSFAPALVVLATLVVPAVAEAGNRHGPKVDDALAAVADGGTATGATELHVVVFSNDDHAKKPKLKVKHRLDLIGPEAGTVSVDDLDALANDDSVSYVALDAPVTPTAASAPVSFPALATLYPTVDGAQTAWSAGYAGAGVGVAVIDSGAIATPDFGSRLTQVLLAGQTTSVDTNGHGTFVTSVLAGTSADGRYVGIAPGASLYDVDVASATGTVYSSDVVVGLDIGARVRVDDRLEAFGPADVGRPVDVVDQQPKPVRRQPGFGVVRDSTGEGLPHGLVEVVGEDRERP